MVRRNRAFLWSLASTVYPGTLWLHTIEMGDASIQASNHLLCTVCICGFTQPNIELLHAFSLATESLVLRNEPASKLQPSNHLLSTPTTADSVRGPRTRKPSARISGSDWINVLARTQQGSAHVSELERLQD